MHTSRSTCTWSLAAVVSCLLLLSLCTKAHAQPQPAPAAAKTASAGRLEFTRLVAHWHGYGDRDAYLKFIDDAQPDIAQIGFYGAHFYSLAHTPFGKGYPAHFPVQGLKEQGDWFEALNKDVHHRNAKVVGHFNVKFLVGDPDGPQGPRGFFKFYNDLWDEKELGPKPVADPRQLLEINADGTPITNNNYSIGQMKEYWACLNNPHWKAVMKAWTKRGIERGVDGYVLNYFYRHNCLCDHCQREFKAYMKDRFTPEQLQTRFDIKNIDTHKFSEIVSWHKAEESTPLRREMLRFSQVANKKAVDEVFVDYGRKLKPGLIVAQWDHLGDFHQISGDERCLLPADLWGKNEDYLWYSSGGSAVYTDLPNGFLGELTLQCRYIRGTFDDKPYTMGKYEHTRIRAAIAELVANGGAPMGFYTNFNEPLARAEIVRYYQFIKKHESIIRAHRPHSEVLLLYPRTQIHAGQVAILPTFKTLGKKLLDEHVLFDIKPDDITTTDIRSQYRVVIDPTKTSTIEQLTEILSKLNRSRFDAPTTVRVSANQPAQGNELDLYFVNYNREEPDAKNKTGRGLIDEKPLPTPEFTTKFQLPPNITARQVTFHHPESADTTTLKFTQQGTTLECKIPSFLVLGLVRVTW